MHPLKKQHTDDTQRRWLRQLVDILDSEFATLVRARPVRKLLRFLPCWRITTPCRSKTDTEATESAIRCVRLLIDQEIASYAHRFTQLSRSCSLPAELLAAIFFHMEDVDCITSSHVCQSWRSVALATPSLWSNIESLYQDPGVLTRRLERIPSGVPLRLTAVMTPPRYNELMCTLRVRFPDLRALWLRLEGLDDDLIPFIGSALSHPAPLLTHLHLLCGATSDRMKLDQYPLLANDAPRLHSLKYHGPVKAICNWSLARRLRSVFFSQPGATTLSTLLSVFNLFENVVTLGIEVNGWDEPVAVIGDTARLTLPASVKGLVIHFDHQNVDPRNFISFLPHSSLPVFETGSTLQTSAAIPGTLVIDVANAVGHPVGLLLLLLDDDDRVAVELRTLSDRHMRFFRNADFSLQLGVHAFRSLVSISFSEDLLPDGSGSYELPALKNLVIVLLEPQSQMQRGHNSIFLLEHARDPLLVCPALTHMVFMSSCGSHTSVTPDLVRAFIHWHVDCPRPLGELSLNRVELIESNVFETAALLALIRDIVPFAGDASCVHSDPAGYLPRVAHLFNWAEWDCAGRSGVATQREAGIEGS